MKPRSLLPFAAGVLLAAAISCNFTDPRGSGPGDSVESMPAARDAGGTPDSAQTGGTMAKPAASPGGTNDAIPVEVVRLESEALEEELFTTGELRANEQMEMRSEEDGRIVGLLFEEGKRVQEGDLLVKINDADLRAERERVRVQKRLAEQREQRSSALLAENTISQQIYDEALGELEVLAAQEAELEARIEKTEIRAPFSGVVGLREVSQGAYITSSQTIATLQSLDPIKIDFSIPEKYAGRVGRGDTLEFTVSGSDNTYRGEVYAVEPRIDDETRTVQVRARASNPRETLLPGAFAKVRLVLDREAATLMVPSIALVRGLDTITVYVAENGVARPRRVEVGRRTQDRVQVTSGLEPGDRVIVTGVLQMRPGVTVDPTEVPGPKAREAGR